jgi:hemerythrin-like metal-binding protein
VGVEEVNRQHKVLIGILNELYNLLQNERSLSAVHRMLTGLVDYAVTHFSYEEHLMQKFGYPDFESHKRSHEALMTQLGQFMQQVDAGDEGVAGELLEFIKAWLVKHIQGVDMEYGPFLNEKGIR